MPAHATDGVIIRLEHVHKSFDGRMALEPTELDLHVGRSLVLIGPSGCGKSTLLRLVIGLLAPDGGRVWLRDRVVEPSSHRALRQRMGYVTQEGGLFPHLTAEGNVALKARDLGWEEARIVKRVAELADLTRFPTAWLDHYPGQLSGGQRQRIGLMRALMLDPEVLLMDEPLGALDPIIRSQLQSELKEVFRRLGKTVLLVTHDMGEAAYLGDEIALMRAGRIVQLGTLEDLLERPADPFVSEFIVAQRPLSEKWRRQT